ncbi:MAG TPA: DUF512 domain-containing protein [Candidatus Manganitrophaceae bacterium]|nr:DUF512 domain-containing protein [Candidatus Manganitrophaceae bacterium]
MTFRKALPYNHNAPRRRGMRQKEVRLSQKSGLEVAAVAPGSVAEEIGIEAGDRLISLNGREIKDILDYRFWVGEEKLLIELMKPHGEVWEIDAEKDLDEDLGLEFPEMKIRQCPNKCFFCFVDQMPEGEREALYIRDEDYRFSFLFGNYITLTNLTRKDKERVFEQKMSPLYVSVHTTDPELRRFMLGNPRARDVLKEIAEMADHGIVMHTQIVLCPDINDGAYLSKSVEELARFYPAVGSLAVVPIGLTRHREGLYQVKEVTVDYARDLLERIKPWQTRFQKEIGHPFVFPADEWFVKAGVDFPPLEAYLDLPQLENGVGMVPLFLKRFESMLPFLPSRLPEPVKITLVTGTSFSSYLEEKVKALRMKGAELEVAPVVNHFFGESVTVAGLMTGRDIIRALKGRSIGSFLLIPSVALNDEKTLFLDGTTPQEIEAALEVSVQLVSPDAEGLMGFLQNIPAVPRRSKVR